MSLEIFPNIITTVVNFTFSLTFPFCEFQKMMIFIHERYIFIIYVMIFFYREQQMNSKLWNQIMKI